MTAALALRLGAYAFSGIFGGLGIFMLWASFINGDLAAYALLSLGLATAVAGALGSKP